MKNKLLYLYIYKYFMASKMWVVGLVVEFSASEAKKQKVGGSSPAGRGFWCSSRRLTSYHIVFCINTWDSKYSVFNTKYKGPSLYFTSTGVEQKICSISDSGLRIIGALLPIVAYCCLFLPISVWFVFQFVICYLSWYSMLRGMSLWTLYLQQ